MTKKEIAVNLKLVSTIATSGIKHPCINSRIAMAKLALAFEDSAANPVSGVCVDNISDTFFLPFARMLFLKAHFDARGCALQDVMRTGILVDAKGASEFTSMLCSIPRLHRCLFVY